METAMLEARTISISINRNWNAVYEAIWTPEAFPKWASGLSKSSLVKDGEVWKAEGPEGPITIKFTDHNVFGVMDHYVTRPGPSSADGERRLWDSVIFTCCHPSCSQV